jgi:hypothetical protein
VGRVRFRASARSLALVMGLVLMAAPLLGGSALADVGGRTLNADPEQDDRPLGDNRVVKGVLSAAPDVGTQINIDFEIDGVGDPQGDGGDVGASRSPDRSCTVVGGTADNTATAGVDESTTCTIKYKSTVSGHDDVRAWLDVDGLDDTVEADMSEGLNGDGTPDGTDVVWTDWFGRPDKGAWLDCAEPQNLELGTDSVSCRLLGTSNAEGWRIDGENLAGANDVDGRQVPADFDDGCVTDDTGACNFELVNMDEVGLATMCYWVDWDLDQGVHAESDADGSQCDEAVKDSAATVNVTDVAAATWRHGRSLSWRALPAPVYGKRFVLRGRISSAEAACVEGQSGDATTTGDGSFSLALRARASARYTASVAATTTCAASSSSAKLVMVHKKVSLRVNRTRVPRAAEVKITATIGPCGSVVGDKVHLYRSLNGGASFRRIATAVSNRDCVATFHVKVRRRTVFQAKSPKQGDEFLGGESPTKEVRLL